LYKLLAIFHKRLLDANFTSIAYHKLLSKRQWEDTSRSEIASQILEIAKHGSGYSSNGEDGATKTRMMYNIFLSSDQLKEFIAVLIESDLLSYDSTIHKFKTTEKGITFLQAYKQIDHMLKEQHI
jgi:predicted transcriptional regulator